MTVELDEERGAQVPEPVMLHKHPDGWVMQVRFALVLIGLLVTLARRFRFSKERSPHASCSASMEG